MDVGDARDRGIGPGRATLALVGLEQAAGMGQQAGGDGPLADQGPQVGAILLGQHDRVFRLTHAGLLGVVAGNIRHYQTDHDCENHP